MPPRLARLLAVVAAVALVGGAFVLRSQLSDDDDRGEEPGAEGGDLTIACDEDLEVVCEQLARADDVTVVVVAAGDVTNDRLSELDGWLTLDPWPEIAAAEAEDTGSEPLVAAGRVNVASSDLVALTIPDLDCEVVTWQCLSDVVEQGRDVGVARPGTSLGLLQAGHAASGLAGGPEASISDFQERAAQDYLSVAARTDPTSTASLVDLIVTRQGFADVVLAPEALAIQAAATREGRRSGLEVRPVEPEARIAVAAAVYATGDRGDRVRDLLAGETVSDALQEQGWELGGERTTGLPAPDVLYAIGQEIAR